MFPTPISGLFHPLGLLVFVICFEAVLFWVHWLEQWYCQWLCYLHEMSPSISSFSLFLISNTFHCIVDTKWKGHRIFSLNYFKLLSSVRQIEGRTDLNQNQGLDWVRLNCSSGKSQSMSGSTLFPGHASSRFSTNETPRHGIIMRSRSVLRGFQLTSLTLPSHRVPNFGKHVEGETGCIWGSPSLLLCHSGTTYMARSLLVSLPPAPASCYHQA